MISSSAGGTRLWRQTSAFSLTMASSVCGTVPSALSRIGLPLLLPEGRARASVMAASYRSIKRQVAQAARGADPPIETAECLDEEYQAGLTQLLFDRVGLRVAERLSIERVALREIEDRLLGGAEERAARGNACEQRRAAFLRQGSGRHMGVVRAELGRIPMQPRECQTAHL